MTLSSVALGALQAVPDSEPRLWDVLPWIDRLGVGLVVVFLALGIVRGLWWQVVRLLGLLVAVSVARGSTPLLTPRLQAWFPELDPRLAGGIVWLGLFLAALVVVALIGRIGKKTLHAMQLGLADRAGGALAGAVTGFVVHAALLVGLLRLAPSEWSGRALQGSQSERVLDALGREFPVLLEAHAAELAAPWLGAGGRPASGDPDAQGASATPAAGESPPHVR